MKKGLLFLPLLFTLGCATTLVRSERVIRDAIAGSEQNRCVLHAPPCLTDDQFKAVNVALYRASVAGAQVTKLEATHAAKPADYVSLYREIGSAVEAFRATKVGGAIGKTLDALSKAQGNLQAFLLKHGVQL